MLVVYKPSANIKLFTITYHSLYNKLVNIK